ncbi:MAG: DUF2125 domain-containing protein, partial [Pseudorhodoplanes sp.]|nr:DUF2125 domain-containing protein [Pseudorhodoplanes sp.]
MAKTKSDRTLRALLALEADKPEPTVKPRVRETSPLPNLDERVDLFLRAMHGSQRRFTDGERAEARDRILGAMALDLAEQAGGSEFAEEAANQPDRVLRRANERKAATGGFGATLINLGNIIRDALLFPLIGPMGGPARLVTASLAVLLVAGGAWSGAWFYSARTAETAIAGWLDWEAKSGRIYDCGSRTTGGFPFRVELRCLDPKATMTSDRITLVANAKEIHTVVSLFQPSVLTAEVTGPISISGAGKSYVGNWTSA